MNQPSSADHADTPLQIDRADVLCLVPSEDMIPVVASQPKPLEQIGFTGIVIPQHSDANINPITDLGLRVFRTGDLPSTLDLADAENQMVDVWTHLESNPALTHGVELASSRPEHEATTLMQMSVPPVPIVPVSEALLYGSALREQRELLRSAVFWRKRFDVFNHSPKLVHAGDDGLLIYIVDSWLVAINQNPDEASIDLGTQGAMWLMIASQRDVHLHGAMLILPPHSAAVVANELAR